MADDTQNTAPSPADPAQVAHALLVERLQRVQGLLADEVTAGALLQVIGRALTQLQSKHKQMDSYLKGQLTLSLGAAQNNAQLDADVKAELESIHESLS